MLGAITLACVVISAYAVLTKVLPGALNPDEIYARLREPFGYWNSVGLMAALGVPGVLWLGTRRTGHQALNALAYPALGLLRADDPARPTRAARCSRRRSARRSGSRPCRCACAAAALLLVGAPAAARRRGVGVRARAR